MADLLKMTLDEWRAEVERRGAKDCKFRCPLCKNIATPRDFHNAGIDPEKVATNCIGRYIGAKGNLNSPTPTPKPCDWAAYGLFGTLNEGIQITKPDGKTLLVFSFAD